MEQQSISLFELNNLVRRGIKACLPGEFWVQAETSDVRSNHSGHCYLEFVQKDERSNALVAKARGMIWSNIYYRLKPYFERETGQAFVSGIKVLVKVTVDFHELYGFSLTVVDIDPTYTVGDMVKRRKEILERLDQEGILTMNKELSLPELPQRVAVISSPTAAGYGDFCNQLLHNAPGYIFYTRLFPAVMQGERTEASIINALEQIYREIDHWDVVVIIRGGGATSDLSGFDTYNLAANCVQFPLPVITGIGHERDDTVLDMVSHTRVKTPTAAAEFLINCMDRAAQRLDNMANILYRVIPDRLMREKDKIERLATRIPSSVQMRLQKEKYYFDNIYQRVAFAWQKRMLREEHRFDVFRNLCMMANSQILREINKLELMEEKIRLSSPDLLLKKGYTITLVNGKALTDVSKLKIGEKLETYSANGRVTSVVENIEKKK